MNKTDAAIFIALFKDAYQKCFAHPLQQPLSETESKQFYNVILEQTGFVIGWKSLKNYSSFVLSEGKGKQENPSIATLDTFARYVLNAPYSDELKRKKEENHYPYWFAYKKELNIHPEANSNCKVKIRTRFVLITTLIVVIVVLISFALFRKSKTGNFIDFFTSTSEDSLFNRGWFIKEKDNDFWSRRNLKPGSLCLFTLNGDNWPDSAHSPSIKNLLLRKISSDCFITEVHLKDFIPHQNWQQAGIILLEDTSFKGKSARLSLMYNDYMGGSTKSSEILIQAITSPGNGLTKPEEIAHKTIFRFETDSGIIALNLRNTALRIEKQDKSFRFLYSNGAMENSAFKEVANQQINMTPKYIGIFALQGFVNNTSYKPACFSFFSITDDPCSD